MFPTTKAIIVITMHNSRKTNAIGDMAIGAFLLTYAHSYLLAT
jgi:hypothetical protein